MSEPVSDRSWIDTSRNQVRRVQVPEVVRPDTARKSKPGQAGQMIAVAQVRGVDRSAVGSTKDQTRISKPRTKFEALLLLPVERRANGLHSLVGEQDRPPPAACFVRPEYRIAAGAYQGLVEM